LGHYNYNIKSQNKLLLSIFLNIGITLSQIIGGILSGSLALLSDALHNFTDVLSLIISYIASVFSRKAASTQRTFGYKRAEILAAFVNALSLIVISIILIKEAIERFIHPQEIQANLVIILSFIAILGNAFSVWLLKEESSKNMNMKTAYLHLFSDMLASFAVLVGGLLMKYYQVFWIDSFLTLCIALYLIVMSIDLLNKSFSVLMLFTPKNISISKIIALIDKIESIEKLHHVHLWQLNEEEIHLEAHLQFKKDIKLSDFDRILDNIEQLLKENFNINHVTIQPEFNKNDPKDTIVQD
jgi:cobalt-zinc-cadmium efflux system protein